MKKRMGIARCCCQSCTRFFDNFRQCHGEEIPEPGPDASCEEAINGFDVTRSWWTSDSGIFTHHALKDNGKIVDGYIEAVVPSGLPADDAVRLYCTKPLPPTFGIGIDSPPPGIGQKWRLCWLDEGGNAFAIEVRGPESSPPEGEPACYNYRVLDITCVGEEVILDDRIIPFYFLGTHNHILSISVCVNESKNLLVVNAGTYSELFDSEDGRWEAYPWNFAHHLSYTNVDQESCETRTHCYPVWIEVPNENPGTYTWGGTWNLLDPVGEFAGSFGIGKSKGVTKGDIIGYCECNAIGDPLFSDDFNRTNETISPPHDSTEHLFVQQTGWFINFGNWLKTSLSVGPTDVTRVLTFVDHYIESPPGVFIQFGWDMPFITRIKVKIPPEGLIHFVFGSNLSIYRLSLKAGSEDESVDGRFEIRKGGQFTELGSELAGTDITALTPNVFHSLSLCWNGNTVTAGLITEDEREFTLTVEADDLPNSSLVYALVPSIDNGNVAGDFFFDDMAVWEATDANQEGGSGSGSGSGAVDDCGCCGPFGCEGRYLGGILRFPPYASDVEGCFWEHAGGSTDGIYTYLGSYSGQRGGKECDLDDTIMIQFHFTVLDESGDVQVSWGGNSAKVKFSESIFGEDKCTLELSTGEKITVGGKLEVDQSRALQMCVGMGSISASLFEFGFTGPRVSGMIGIPQPTLSQVEIEHNDASIANVTITHGLYDRNCATCGGEETVPCEDTEKANCKDGKVDTTQATLHFDSDYENDLCCDELVAAMRTAVLMKPSLTTTLVDEVDCCDVPASGNIEQCTYTWTGGGEACLPPNFANPDHFMIRVALHRYQDGYRYCGSLEHGGSIGGLTGILSGISNVVATLAEEVDCTDPPSATIPLTCYQQLLPGFEVPFCGLSNVVIVLG